MTDHDKYLTMLKSPNTTVRFDACEDLRVATESSPEVILALEEATKDENEGVAERAKQALGAEVHLRMARKMGRYPPISETEIEPEIKQELEQTDTLLNKKQNASKLGITSLICVIVALGCLIPVRHLAELATWTAMGSPGAATPLLFLIPFLVCLGLAAILPGIAIFLGIQALRIRSKKGQGLIWPAWVGIIVGPLLYVALCGTTTGIFDRPITLFAIKIGWKHLQGISLRQADLQRIDLSGANLRGADLSGANLSNANLREIDMENFDSRLSDANLSGADLSGANLHNTRLYDANLSLASLIGTDLSNADLRGVFLKGAKIDDSTQIDAKWRRVWEIVTQGAAGRDLKGEDLTHANLNGADLRGANLRDADLSGADLSKADLDDANLSGANLLRAIVSREQLSKATSLAGATMPNGTIYK